MIHLGIVSVANWYFIGDLGGYVNKISSSNSTRALTAGLTSTVDNAFEGRNG